MKTSIRLILCLVFTSMVSVNNVRAHNFVHPGNPWTINDLEQMKANRTVYPWSVGWNLIVNSNEASLDYEMQGPFEGVYNKPSTNQQEYIDDGYAVLYHALQWYFTGNSAHAEKAISILDAWATTHTTWGGTSIHLHASWRGGNYVMGAEILRHTYPGWTEENTRHCEDYFLNVMWPQFNVPNPLRSANQGANNLMGAIRVAVFCNDTLRFNQCIDAFLNDPCGGISNTLPNGQNGDMGRDQGHSGPMNGNLATVCEVAWAQGVDLYGVLENRLLKCNEYWSKFNLGEDVDWVDHGTCYGYYTAVSEDGRGADRQSMLATLEMIYGAYVVRKGLTAPYTEAYRDGLAYNEETFLHRKDAAYMSTASTIEDPRENPTNLDVTSFTGIDVGSVGLAGSSNYNNNTWIVEGAGNSIDGSSDAFHYAYKKISGDGALIAKVNAIENTDASAKAAVVIRSSLASNSKSLSVALTPSPGAAKLASSGFDAADGSGSQSFPLAVEPMWLKVERKGNRVTGYVSPNGIAWAPMQGTIFTMPDDYYIGLGVSSNDNSNLNTSVFSNVKITSNGAPEPDVIQAEDYKNMSGIVAETTTDVDGGSDITSLDVNDWMEYEINVPQTGNYAIFYRVASESTDGLFTLSIDGRLYQQSFPATGGGQNWVTQSSDTTLFLQEGLQTIRLTANSAAWKINWMQLKLECSVVPVIPYAEIINELGEPLGREINTEINILPGKTICLSPEPALGGTWSWVGPNDFTSDARIITLPEMLRNQSGSYVVKHTNACGYTMEEIYNINVYDTLRIEAEDYTAMEGLAVESTTDVSGGSNLTSFDATDWVEYEVNVPFTATYFLDFRVASESAAGNFTLSLDGEDMEQVGFEATGGTQTWNTISSVTPIYLKAGIQTLRLTSNSAGWNINWMQLNANQNVRPCNFPFTHDGFTINDEAFTWRSGLMDISCENNISIFLSIKSTGALQASDYLNVYYKLDGGEKIPISENTGFIVEKVVFAEKLPGDMLELIVESSISNATKAYTVSDINILHFDPFARLEVEDCDDTNSLRTENCQDVGGGLNAGWIKNGHWFMFKDVKLDDVNSFDARVATLSEGTSIEVRLGSNTGTLLGTILVPLTGGNQTWETASVGIGPITGIYDVVFVCKEGGFNINWFQPSAEVPPSAIAEITSNAYTISQSSGVIKGLPDNETLANFKGKLAASENGTFEVYTSNGRTVATDLLPGYKVIVTAEDGKMKKTYTIQILNIDPFVRLEVEDCDASSKLKTENCQDVGGGLNAAWITDGQWFLFKDIKLDGVNSFDARIAAPTAGTSIEIRLGSASGTLLGTIEVPLTGAWQTWKTASVGIKPTTGIRDVVFVCKAGGFNINWFEPSADKLETSIAGSLDLGLRLFPNPVNDELIIQLPSNEEAQLYILNSIGAQVCMKSIQGGESTVDVSALNTGIYIVCLTNKKGTVYRKIVKK